MRNGVVLIGALAAVFAASGCGGSSSDSTGTVGRFSQHGFDITFRYPESLEQSDDLILGGTAGAADTARAGVGINRENVILVTRYDLRSPVTDENVGQVRNEVDGVIERLAGKPVPGRSVTFGGLPGYGYRVALPAPKGAVSRLFVLFDGPVEYFFNCQSTPEARAVLDGACDQALGTLERL